MAAQSTRTRRQQRTRDAILAAALDIVITDGVAALSVREVARRVDYSPAGLYEYFGSREEIVAALVSEGYRRFAIHLTNVPLELPPYDRLVELGIAYVDFARSNPQHYLLMFTGLSEWWLEGKPKVDERGAYQMLVDTVQRGIDEGVFPTRAGFGVDEISYMCWALVHGMAMLQLNQLQGVQSSIREKDREVIRTLANGIMNPQ